MNKLSQLMRAAQPMPLRKKISGVNMQMRKEIRRMKKLNIYSREFTGEQNDHGWFTPKRFKALGVFLEATRNVHPGTYPIKPELKKEISEKFVEDSHWMYYRFRNYMSQIITQQQVKASTVTAEEIAHLPAHLRDEITKKQEEAELPKIINPNFIYNQQKNIYLPQDERYRINLILKIENPPEDKDEEELKDIGYKND